VPKKRLQIASKVIWSWIYC